MLIQKPFHEASHQELAKDLSTQELRLLRKLLTEMDRSEFLACSKDLMLYVMCDSSYKDLPQDIRTYIVIMFQFFENLYLAERHEVRI